MSMQFKQQIPPGGALGAQPQPVTWYVISQTEVTQPGPQGRLVSGHKIVFGLSTGDTGSVFLPDDQYSIENAQSAIQAKVALIVGVGALSGSNSASRSG